MSKKSTIKSPMTTRVKVPKIFKDKDGTALIMCPFCEPPHPLATQGLSKCGTRLVVTAEQTIIRAKYNKNVVCAKCGKNDGEMVLFQEGFIHTYDCKPGVIAMTKPPEYSRYAPYVYALRFKWMKRMIEYFTGEAIPVHEVATNGERTGVTLGYFFLKKDKTHAKRIPASS